MTEQSFSDMNEKLSFITMDQNEISDSNVVSATFETIEQSDSDESIIQKSTLGQVQLNFDHLKDIIYELGLIKLCWPEIVQPVFEDRENFPDSYISNSDKEKVLLLYAENFRLQFCNKYPQRKPLFLACENECGIQVSNKIKIKPPSNLQIIIDFSSGS